MDFKYFSRNGEIRPIEEAVVSLSNIEYQYGFGVYESIRVAHDVIYFLEDHIERLLESARTIGLDHPFSPEFVAGAVQELTKKNAAEASNVKIVLIGPSTSLRASGQASLNIMCLNPLFSDKKLYKDGVHCTTYEYERAFPHAKTLNMLQSYLAYAEAKESGAYDALLINSEGCITEGTRTNFFCIKDRTLYSPSEDHILLGVTRKAVLHVAARNRFVVEQTNIPLADLHNYDGAFLTSTSSKILPIKSVGKHEFGEQPSALKELMTLFDTFLGECKGILK